VVLGLRGRRNLDQGEEDVADAEQRTRLHRRAARLIALTVLIVALAAVGLFLHFFLQEKASSVVPV
jgi:flagellar basal body-associated protein FliL